MYQFSAKGKICFPKNKFIRRKKRNDNTPPRVIRECYCPNGHSMIDDQILFDETPGIKVKVVRQNGDEGYMVMSPFYGNYSKITLQIKLKEGDMLDMYCPECGKHLAVYSHCLSCDSKMQTLFTNPALSFSDCLGVCQKVGCHNSKMTSNRRMLSYIGKTCL